MRTLSAGVLALLAALALAAPAPAQLKPSDVGVVIAENFDRPAGGGRIGQIEASATAELGAGWGSIYVSWNAFQPNGPGALDKGMVDFYRDRFVSLKEAGRKVNVTFIDTPAWASQTASTGDDRLYYPPQDPQSFGAFVTLFATEFAREVDAYELGNEPDGGVFWKPGPNPVQYAGYAKAGAAAVKAADQVDGNQVFIGATVGANDEFMEEVLTKGGLAAPENRKLWDAVAFHSGTGCKTDPPQKGDVREETGSADLHNNLSTAYREMAWMMRSIGIADPVLADTAAGWATMPEPNSCNVDGPNFHKKPGGVDEATQSLYLRDYLGCALQDPELRYVFIFSLYDVPDKVTGTPDKWDQRMGLRKHTQEPKASFRDLAAALKTGIPAFSKGGFCGGYVDHEKPDVQITTSSPVVGGVPVFSGPLQMTAKSSDEHPIKAVRITVDGKNVPGTTKDGVLDFPSWQGAKDLKLGEHTIRATAEDEAGNIAEAAPVKIRKVAASQMPRTATTLTAKAIRIRGRRVTIKGRLSWPKGLVKPSGRVRIWFKKGRFVSKYGVTPSKPFRKTFTLRKPGRWKVMVWYDAEAPFKTSRVKTFTVRVR